MKINEKSTIGCPSVDFSPILEVLEPCQKITIFETSPVAPKIQKNRTKERLGDAKVAPKGDQGKTK